MEHLLDSIIFEYNIENITPHSNLYPDNKKHINILQEYINK